MASSSPEKRWVSTELGLSLAPLLLLAISFLVYWALGFDAQGSIFVLPVLCCYWLVAPISIAVAAKAVFVREGRPLTERRILMVLGFLNAALLTVIIVANVKSCRDAEIDRIGFAVEKPSVWPMMGRQATM